MPERKWAPDVAEACEQLARKLETVESTDRHIIEIVPAREIKPGERVIFDRFGEVETILQIELRRPTEDMRRMRTDHPVRRKVGMPLMEHTPVIRVCA